MNRMTDEEIAAQVQRGDTQSFGLLVERYEPKLLRYGRKFLWNGRDVEDLVQDVFIKAYSNIQSFNAAMRFSPWLYRIAHNEFVNALKRNKKLPLFVFDFDTIFPNLFATETADQNATEREMKDMLDRCIGELDPKYREPMVLHYFEDISYQEIADILRIPISTVGVRISRAKTILRTIVQQHYPHHE